MARRGLDAEQVVDAACALADAEGLEAVTLARVASALGVRTPSLYNHVAGLDGLRRGVALRGVRELTAALREAAVGRAGADAVRAIAHAQRDYARAHPGRYAASAVAAPAGDEEWAAAATEAVEVILGALRGLELAGDDAVHAVRALRSAVHGFAALEMAGGFGMPVDVDASFERLIDVLASGLAGAPR
jgi:AcrR family transcriptional regulator